MDPQELTTGVRWELLKRISVQPSSGSELAQLMGTSAANISQHLKLLELAGLVAKERVNGKTVNYRIADSVALVTLLTSNPSRFVLPVTQLDEMELRLMVQSSTCTRALRRFLLQYEELVGTFSAFGLIKESENEAQLLVIADDVRALRKEYANTTVGDKRIVIWSHTPKEMEEGLARKENYFLDKLHMLRIVHDPDGKLQHWKEVAS